MKSEFHSQLRMFAQANDSKSVNTLLMKELGLLLVKNREDFVALLNESGVEANVEMTDAELVKLYMQNISDNQVLMVGTALLVNMQNKKIGFDGEDEISDEGVKHCYNSMYEYFCGADGDAPAQKIGLGGLLGGGGLGTVLGEAGKFANKIADNQHAKKFGASDTAAKKLDAKNAMVQSVIDQRKKEAEAAKAKQDAKDKTKKILIISGSVVLGLAVIGLIIYKVKKG